LISEQCSRHYTELRGMFARHDGSSVKRRRQSTTAHPSTIF
jgi:hypothetical protein